MITVPVTLETQFYDLDPMGVVWHGNYTRFFEQARCKLLDKIGYNYTEMKDSGYVWPIVDLHTKYVRPVRFPQQIVIETTLVEYLNRIKISYILRDDAGNILTKATTTQVAVDAATGELCLESPAVFRARVEALL